MTDGLGTGLSSVFAGPADDEKRVAAWCAARAIVGYPDHRYDCDGRLIRWLDYGRYTEHGWQIDLSLPKTQSI
jgi:hypothetical protein